MDKAKGSIQKTASKLTGLGRGGFSGRDTKSENLRATNDEKTSAKTLAGKDTPCKSVSRITFKMYDEVNGLVKRLASKLTDRARNDGHKTTINRDMLARCWLRYVDVLPWDDANVPMATEADIDAFIRKHFPRVS